MAIKINKAVLVVGILLVFVGVLGAAGFVIWRLNQPDDVTPGESEAGVCIPPAGKIGDDGGGGCCGSYSGTDGGVACTGDSGGCRDWEVCDVSNGACASGTSCREASCRADGGACTGNSQCCSGNCSGGTCQGGSACKRDGDACSSAGECCSNTCTGGICSAAPRTCDAGNTGWCGTDTGADGKCSCSNFNEPKCHVHAGSGCAWIDGACTCNSGEETGGCVITGSASSFTCDKGPCKVSVAACYTATANRSECESRANEGVGCATSTITLSEGQSYSLTPPGSCGIYQLDATGCTWNRAETGCVWSDTCDEDEEQPTCGNGVIDAGEQCDPPGNTTQCSGGGTCSASCTCPAVVQEYLTVSGDVFCQDPNGERYPVIGAKVRFTKTGSAAEVLSTNSSGAYSSASNTTTPAQKPFTVQFDSFTNPSSTLPTGVVYSAMVGPVVDNSSICTSGKCSTCSGSYSTCNGLTNGSNAGFNLKFTNCSPAQVNPDWSIQKTNTPVCYQEETVNAYAEISYTVTVTNVTGGGTVTTVEDDLDADISDSWVSAVTPTGVVSGGKITWNAGYTFTSGQSMTFTYKVRIPRALFGQALDNHVIATPESGDQLHAYSTALAICGEYKPPLPSTGIFDSTVVRIVLGVLCVVLGYAYYRFGLFDGMARWLSQVSGSAAGKVKHSVSSEGKRERWERKVVTAVDKRRNTRK